MENSNQLRMRLCVEAQRRVMEIGDHIQEKQRELSMAKDVLKENVEAMLAIGSFDSDSIFVYDGTLFKVSGGMLIKIKGVNLDRESK